MFVFESTISRMSSLSLFAVVFVVILSTLCAPICAFRAVPSIGIMKVALHNKNKVCTPTLLYNSQEDEMMEDISKEVIFQQGVQSGIDNLQSLPENAPKQRESLDPLIASLTRIDEPTPANVPTRQVPLFGGVDEEEVQKARAAGASGGSVAAAGAAVATGSQPKQRRGKRD